jgi:hypothetical protein
LSGWAEFATTAPETAHLGELIELEGELEVSPALQTPLEPPRKHEPVDFRWSVVEFRRLAPTCRLEYAELEVF